MERDVCPQTRLRCPCPGTCNEFEMCQANRTLKPMAESSLNQAEAYRLAMSEKGIVKP